jgi:hypothetical protein
MGDMILVEGLPVGSILGFAWNLLGTQKNTTPIAPLTLILLSSIVSASFQYVGFMLTYLLHTSHAAKVKTPLHLLFTQTSSTFAHLFLLVNWCRTDLWPA